MEEKNPYFSIIVPTYNRPKKLADCLESLSHLDYPRDRFEVIVIDDKSDQSLQPVVDGFTDQLEVTLIKQIHAGPAAARNTGVRKAKGDFLVFLDDDCITPTHLLQKLSARCLLVSDHAIGGKTINELRGNLYSAASQAIIDVVYSYYNPNPRQACFFASNNLTVPADRFRTLGGFDVTFTTSEDRDLCDRWLHHGLQMTYAPEVVIYHCNELNFSTFWRQHFNYGRGAYRYHQARARRGTGRFKPDIKLYIRLICYPFRQKLGYRTLWLTLLVVVSQVASTMGFFGEGFNQIKKR